MNNRLHLTFLAALLAFGPSFRASAAAADAFPYSIPVAAGAADFAPGDRIEVTSLRGDRPHLEVGGRYEIEGTYTLASADSARLGWSVTTRGPSGPTPVAAEEHTTVSRGSGTFTLVKTFRSDGWPHVSFTADGRSFGNLYFGEQGADDTVLRRIPWSREQRTTRASDHPVADRAPDGLSPANAAILEYLGDAVPPPDGLDSKYTALGVMGAFNAMAKKAGWEVKRVAVDETEFPYLVYGVVARVREWQDLKAMATSVPGYGYAGSVTSTKREGMVFAINLTPNDRYPADLRLAASRRLMVRLQLLMQRADRE